MLVPRGTGLSFRCRTICAAALLAVGTAFFGFFDPAWAAQAPKVARAATALDGFREGIAAFRQGRFGDAVEWFRQSGLEAAPPWEEYGRFYLMRSLHEGGRSSEALEEARGFLKRFPESPLLDRVKIIEIETLLATGAFAAAREGCQELLKTQDRADVRLLLGQALEAQGALSAALEQYLQIRRNWSLSPEDRRARKRQREILISHPELDTRGPVAAHLEEASLYMGEQVFEEALGHYRALLAAPLDPSAEREARTGLIRALIKTGRVAESQKELDRLRERFPGSPEEVGSMLSVASALWNRGQPAQALPLLRFLLENHTDTAEARQASFMMGRILMEQGELREAVEQFRRTRFLFPKTAIEAEAAWWEAWSGYLLGEYGACARHLQACLEAGLWPAGVERNRALYWEARCLEKSVSRDAGRALYTEILQKGPADYYSVLAEKRLRRVPLTWGFDGPPDPRVVSSLTAPQLSCRIPDPALPVLIAVGLDRDAAERLDWLRQRPDLRDLPLEHWIESYGWARAYRSALRIALPLWPAQRLADLWERPSILSQIPAPIRQAVYPLAYWDLVRDRCAERGLDPFLVLGLMKQESLFVPDIASPAGAVGLMQIMPSTGSKVARELGLAGFRTVLLEDPEINLRIGTAYLAGLVDRYGARWPWVLAAYNAGPEAVERWKASMPAAEQDEFVEGISYKETRMYVRKVLEGWFWYRKLYGGAQAMTGTLEPEAGRGEGTGGG